MANRITFTDMKEIWHRWHQAQGIPTPPIMTGSAEGTTDFVPDCKFFRLWGSFEADIETAVREEVEFPIAVQVSKGG